MVQQEWYVLKFRYMIVLREELSECASITNVPDAAYGLIIMNSRWMSKVKSPRLCESGSF